MANNKNKDSLNKIYTRIAWYDRESSRYDYGEWHDISKNLNYENLGKWVNNQNRNHPRVKYWLENISEGDSKKLKMLNHINLIQSVIGRMMILLMNGLLFMTIDYSLFFFLVCLDIHINQINNATLHNNHLNNHPNNHHQTM